MPFDRARLHRDGPQACAVGALDVAEGRAPEWVCIVPLRAGETHNIRVEARDGRIFNIPDAAELVAASNAELARQRGPHPVDKDHDMAWLGGPALGWTDRYELRGDGIYAHMERWLAEGAALIESFKYRYSSCNVWCDRVNEVRDDWGYLRSYELQMTCFAGFTITNIPALEVYAMADRRQENTRMSMKQILELLRLPDTAGPDDVLGAVQKLTAGPGPAASPSLDQYVPRAEFDRVSAELAALKDSASKAAEAAAEAERKQLLDKALADGKVIPATAEVFLEMMNQPGGVERFKKYCERAPAIGGPVEETRKPPVLAGEGGGLSPDEKHALAVTGMSAETYLKARADRRAARATT